MFRSKETPAEGAPEAEEQGFMATIKQRAAQRRAKWSSTDEKDPEEEAKVDDESEKSAVKLCRKARNKFIQRGLLGTVTISRTIGITTVEVELEITEDDIGSSAAASDDDTASEAGEENELTTMETKAVSAMDHMLNVLAKRAYGSWRDVPFRENATLSRTVTLGVVGPFLKFGLEFGITLSATVPTLIAHAARAGIRA